jgi:hypothetical protein
MLYYILILGTIVFFIAFGTFCLLSSGVVKAHVFDYLMSICYMIEGASAMVVAGYILYKTKQKEDVYKELL